MLLPRLLAALGVCLAAVAPSLHGQNCTPPSSWPTPTTLPSGVGTRYDDIPYWSGSAETLDCYLPNGWSGSQALPTVLFLHGGGWFRGDKRDPGVVQLARALLGLGYPVVVPNYTLAGTDCQSGTFPQEVLEARSALAWIRRATNALPSGTDACLPPCIVVVGSSAGAHLAAMLGTVDGANDGGLFTPDPVADVSLRADFVVSISPVTDFHGLGANGYCPDGLCYLPPIQATFPDADACGASSGFPPDYPLLTPGEWQALFGSGTLMNGCWPPEAFLGCQWNGGSCPQGTPGPLPTNGLTGNLFADASPLNWVDAGDSPIHIVHGQCDPIVPFDQSERLAAAYPLANVPATFRVIQTAGHGISGPNALLLPNDAADEVDDAVRDWMALGGCAATVLPLGCGVNPFTSLTHVGGAPVIGNSVELGIDNPLGTQGSPSFPFLVLANAPDPNFPCGTLLAGYGMAGPGAIGELLISLAPPNPVGPIVTGGAWSSPGSPSVLSLSIPPKASLAFKTFYAQGLLFDPAALGGVRFGLTDAVELVIGI